ncbi:MAG TPA: hypothetical protein VLT47_01245 [Anaeromyxobacteraceae bacterium]|nr:hypothetical protein [Anaeromyxobacteraceae bacterium]
MKWMAVAAAMAVAAMTVGGAGCTSTGRIRQIDSVAASRCKYLGVAQSIDRTGWSMRDDQLGGMSEIRRRVDAMGGNAYVVTHGAAYNSGPVQQADVYRCR